MGEELRKKFKDEQESRWLQELSGESKDRPLHAAMEDMASRLVKALAQSGPGTLQSYPKSIRQLCDPNVRLLANMEGPGEIYEGVDEILNYCAEHGGKEFISVIIVDRLRITCIMDFLSNPFVVEGVVARFAQQRIIIMDMNSDYKFTRIEVRCITPEVHAYGQDDVQIKVEDPEE
ncbi:hypothetical protein BDP81DRAFT_145199 [Colletotrichum phormii]|uniref:Uncharacterized protein n=1 Tax=Colletotrichum phormii TaxID=359342 RepID=A0AAJ0E9C9_9PEZI|nr:uncharacterized protein BDP81DRAFT_145199 [Colletotrichum phormii]KAK1622650.1 hypothetical protein BDP81DRAFT_145199 [Colletotrichum phormii]